LHAVSAVAWLVGGLLSPALEGIAFGVLAPVAVWRWRELGATLRGSPRLRSIVIGYAVLMAWVCASAAWAPAGATPAFHLRQMVAPLLIVHAGVSVAGLMVAALLGGGCRAAVAGAELAGLPMPAGLSVDYVSKGTLGIQLLGVAAFTFVRFARGWRQWPVPLAVLALWAVGSAQLASRGSLLAGLAGGAIGLASQTRSWRTAAAVGLGLCLAGAAAAAVLQSSPLLRKFIDGSVLTVSAAAEGRSNGVLDPETIDNYLSYRLVLWDWTVRHLSGNPVAGHGLGTWSVDFNAAAASGSANPPWRSWPLPLDFRMAHAHNLYLQVAYEQGAVGVGLLALVLVLLLRCFWGSPDPAIAVFGMTLLVTFLVARCNMGGDIDSRVSGASFAFLLCAGAVAARPGEPFGERLTAGR